MSMFSRFGDIVQANINSMLDKAEDPQKMLVLIVTEMEEALGEIRSVAAKYIAEQKTLQRKSQVLASKINHWQQNAELAITKGKEDLAKSALMQKQTLVQELETIKEALTEIDTQVSRLKNDADQLAEKLAEARNKQKAIQMRFTTAKTRLNVKAATHQEKIQVVMSRFDTYEHRMDDLEARIEAFDIGSSGSSLKQQFAEMEQEDKLNEELEALKKKVA